MPKLSEVKHNQQIKFPEAAIHMGCHCPMHTVLAMLRKINGISSLVVGMPECACYSRLVINEDFNDEQTKHYCYVLNSKEIIFGSGQGVKKAIEEMETEGAERIVVLKTCTPALIGEAFDYDGSIPVAVLDIAHFKTNGYMSGFNMLLDALVQFMKKKEIGKPVVNFIGSSDNREINDWIILLTSHGYSCNQVNGNLNFLDLEALSNAALNVCLSYEWHGLCLGLARQLSVPYVTLFDCYEPSQYLKCLKDMETILQVDGIHLCAQNKLELVIARWKTKVEWALKSKMRDINLGNQDVQGIAFAIALNKLGYEVKHIHIEEWDEMSIKWRPELLALGIDPMVHYMTGETPFGVRGYVGELLNRDKCLVLQSLIGIERIEFLLNEIDAVEANAGEGKLWV